MARERRARKHRVPTTARTTILAGLMVLLCGCVPGVPVSVANHSSQTLTKVVVSGKSFSESVGDIPAGGREIVYARPRGESESGLRIAFEANGSRYSSARDLDADDHLASAEITIGSDFDVVITFNSR